MPQMSKKLSRRDAIKLLGAAAGATLLANLPSKWSKPELASGVLPAHAQTSVLYTFDGCFSGETITLGGPTNNFGYGFSENITPAAGNVPVNYAITTVNGITINTPAALNGSVLTSAGGQAHLQVDMNIPNLPSSITVTFEINGNQCAWTVNFIIIP